MIGSAAAWPLAARAQQLLPIRRVGVLMPYVESDNNARQWVNAFAESLREFGWINDQNIKLDFRWPGPNPDRLRADAAELVHSTPDVLVAGATAAVAVLQHETHSIPIVFANVADPVRQGFVASLARPGGNTTGFAGFDFSLGGKWVQAVKEISPSASQIGVIYNPETAPFYGSFLPFIERAARQMGIKQTVTPIHDAGQIVRTLEELVGTEGSNGLIVIPAALFTDVRGVIISTAARLSLPTVYPYSYFAQAGGLLSYGPEVRDMYRRASAYVDRILRGAKVSDLPVQQPTKFELIINLKTAKALGLSVPPALLAIADEVIE